MSTYKPIDSKREEFRKYLERAGVMDALTKVLVMLYEEPDKPEDALEFVRMNLGDKRPAMSEMEALKTELDGALFRVKELEEELFALRGGDGGGAGAEFGGRSSLPTTEGAAPGPADTTSDREV